MRPAPLLRRAHVAFWSEGDSRDRLTRAPNSVPCARCVVHTRRVRAYLAGVVLGATLVAAAWLYSYETWQTIEVFDRFGRVAASTRVKSQPWWSVYGALALAVAGTCF